MKMRKMELLLVLIYIFNTVVSYKTEEDKNYFQLYPSEDKEKPYLFHVYNLKSQFLTVNSTEGDDMKIIENITRTHEAVIKNLSSVILYNDTFLVKTCFGPNKIVEIIDEKNQPYTPKDVYFKSVKNNLENIKYCYSTTFKNPYKVTEHVIATYWTDIKDEGGKEIYTHRVILFFPKNVSFSEIYDLKTNGHNFYAQSCTNLRSKFIYCNMDQSIEISKRYHFSIISDFLNADNIKISFKLVYVFARFSNTIYHKPIGIYKYFYSKTGRYADYFLTEYHDEKNSKTRLMTSVYVNYNPYSFILRFEDMDIYKGINIEDTYINPNLFNHLLPNMDELIVLYIMKGVGGKNQLLLNKYDCTKDLKYKTKFDKYSLSNYLRDDICKNPKYMQSTFINSFISYDIHDKGIIGDNKDNKYFVYQRDIATFISCNDENGNNFYQAKKIQLPQCLNVLNQINGKSNLLIFPNDENDVKITLDFDEPNYKSLRNVEIEFFDSYIYNRYIVVQGVKNGDRLYPINKTVTLNNIERLEFSRTMNYRIGKIYQIPYRIKQTGSFGVSNTCHLTSDICYFEFYYGKGKDGTDIPPEDIECQNCEEYLTTHKCNICKNITGLIVKNEGCGCECDEEKGFKKDLITVNDISSCVCKDGYSFYKNIEKCLPNPSPNNTEFCVIGKAEVSLIDIYNNRTEGITAHYEDGKLTCNENSGDNRPIDEEKIWFNLGEDEYFYWEKISKCVYIIYNNSIVMYSNRDDCKYNDENRDDYNDIFKINNESDYYSLLNSSYEYQINDNKYSLIKKNNNKTFYIINNYTSNLKEFSSVKLSEKCIEKVKEKYNLRSLLIFVATIKKENIISTQVEYQFYNPVPELIHQKLDLSVCYEKENTNSNSSTRLLEVVEEWRNNDNYSIDIDEIIVDVQVDWSPEQNKTIHELTSKGINIFDSSDPFYIDVCFNYTTDEKTDIYLQDRKERYYITDPLCETGCRQVGYDETTERVKCLCKIKNIGYDETTERVKCLCKIKNTTNDYDNVTFSPNNLDESFVEKYYFPNIKVMNIRCFLKGKKFTVGQIISFILLIFFIIISIINTSKMCKKVLKNGNQIDITNKKKGKEGKEEKKRYFRWEEALENLKSIIQSYMTKEDTTKKKMKDPEVFNDFRRKPPKEYDDDSSSNKITLENNNNKEIISSIKKTEKDKNSDNTEKIFVKPKKNNKSKDDEKETIITQAKSINQNDVKLNINKPKDKNQKSEDEMSNYIAIYSKKPSSSLLIPPDKQSEISSNFPKLKEIDYDKANDKVKNNNEKKEKMTLKTNNSNKANPPSKEQKEPIDGNSYRDSLNNNNNNNNNGEERNDIERKVKKCSYYYYIFYINKDKEDKRYLSILLSKIISDSFLVFIWPCCITKYDKNPFLWIKLPILILYIACFMSFNIFMEFRLSDLYLYYPDDDQINCGFGNYILNFAPPLFIYLLLHFFRKTLSLREFYLEENYRINNILEEYHEKNPIKCEIGLHKEKTRINKFRNNLENSMKLISLLGIIILTFNFYLVSCFCGIYQNSFLSVCINVLINIAATFFLSLIIHIIESSIECIKKSKIDLKNCLCKLYIPFCGIIYLLLYCLPFLNFKEEFNNLEDDDDDIDDKRNNRNQRNNNNNEGTVTNMEMNSGN